MERTKFSIETSEQITSAIIDNFPDEENIMKIGKARLGTVKIPDGSTIPICWYFERRYEMHGKKHVQHIFYEIVDNVLTPPAEYIEFEFSEFNTSDIGKTFSTKIQDVAEVGYLRGEVVLYRKFVKQLSK